MGSDSQAQRVLERDAAARRLRRVTLFAGALAAAGTGVVAAVTASATHTRAAVRSVTTAAASTKTIPAVPAPTATVSSATVSSGSAAPSAPQSAPVASSAPPVAVSGGSAIEETHARPAPLSCVGSPSRRGRGAEASQVPNGVAAWAAGAIGRADHRARFRVQQARDVDEFGARHRGRW